LRLRPHAPRGASTRFRSRSPDRSVVADVRDHRLTENARLISGNAAPKRWVADFKYRNDTAQPLVAAVTRDGFEATY
jgi:hypothetical protein